MLQHLATDREATNPIGRGPATPFRPGRRSARSRSEQSPGPGPAPASSPSPGPSGPTAMPADRNGRATSVGDEN
jgi:hypothetical protein